MIGIKSLFVRLWLLVVAMFFYFFVMSLADTAQAGVFPACDPQIVATDMPRGDTQAAQERQQWAERICDAQQVVYEQWELRLQALYDAQEDLRLATNSGDWAAWRKRWAAVLPRLKELEAAALADRDAPGAANLLSLLRGELHMWAQNAGLPAAATLDEFSERLLAGLDSDRASGAASAGVTLVGQAAVRAVEFANGLAKQAKERVLAERQQAISQRVAIRKEKLAGTTIETYFGGFYERVREYFYGWVFMLVLVGFLGAAIGRRKNPNAALAACVAFLVPSALVFGLAIIVPVLNQAIPGSIWLALLALGTLVNWLYGDRILAPVIRRVGEHSATGRMLLIYSALLRNLRESAGAARVGKDATHGSARWATAQEAQPLGTCIRLAIAPSSRWLAYRKFAPASILVFDLWGMS